MQNALCDVLILGCIVGPLAVCDLDSTAGSTNACADPVYCRTEAPAVLPQDLAKAAQCNANSKTDTADVFATSERGTPAYPMHLLSAGPTASIVPRLLGGKSPLYGSSTDFPYSSHSENSKGVLGTSLIDRVTVPTDICRDVDSYTVLIIGLSLLAVGILRSTWRSL